MSSLDPGCLPFWLRPLARRMVGYYDYPHTFFCYLWAAAGFRYRTLGFAPLDDEDDLPTLLIADFQRALRPWNLSEEEGYGLFKALFSARAVPSSALVKGLAEAWEIPEAAFLPMVEGPLPLTFDKALAHHMMRAGVRPHRYRSETFDLPAALQGKIPVLREDEIPSLADFIGYSEDVMRVVVGFPRRSVREVAFKLGGPIESLKRRLIWERKLPPEHVDLEIGGFYIRLEEQILCMMRRRCRKARLNAYLVDVWRQRPKE